MTWTLGRWLVLRHAGMPFDWLEELGGDDELDRAADAVRAAGDALNFNKMVVGGGHLDISGARRLARAIEGAEPDPPVKAWNAAVTHYRDTYLRTYRSAEHRLRQLAGRREVCEAVFLSSPEMWHNMWQRYRAAAHRPDDGATPPNAAARRVHRQVYTYLQRFCAKNETVSHFGPLGYGRLDAPKTGLTRDLPVRRHVFITHWAVDELVSAIRLDRQALVHLPVNVVYPERLAAQLPDVAADLGADSRNRFGDLAAQHGGGRALLRTLGPALREGVVELGPSFAAGRADEFGQLRQAVDDLAGSGEALAGWAAALFDLEQLRGEFERAAFPDRIGALSRLEDRFTALTGKPARRPGGVYADRLLVYEECSSPFHLSLSAEVTARLTESLQSALRFSAGFGDLVRQAHQEQVLARWPAGVDSMGLREYAELLADTGGRRSRFHTAEPLVVGAEDDVTTLVPEPQPGPRYALPDVSLAAGSVADLAAGRFRTVVSRVHHHLLLDSWLAVAHPRPHEFAGAANRWIAGYGEPSGLLGVSVSRRNKAFYVYPGEQLALRPRRAVETEGAGALLPPEALTVRRGRGAVGLYDRGGRPRQLSLPLADLVGHPPLAALSAPPVLHAPLVPAGEQPRLAPIHIGDALYQRCRCWLPAPDWRRLDPPARYLALRDLARTNRLPRFAFFRTDRDRKPYLLDTRSVFGAELLVHATQPGERLQVEPMVPEPDQLWLTDSAGRRYTCELRILATTGGGATGGATWPS